jgi:hypothetical protein
LPVASRQPPVASGQKHRWSILTLATVDWRLATGNWQLATKKDFTLFTLISQWRKK